MIDRAWLKGLPETENWRKILPVRDGWGSDEKYEIYTHTGEHLFLRATSDAYTKQKYGEFAFVQRCQGIGFLTPKTIACGMHHGRVYQILSWVEGEPLSREIHHDHDEDEHDHEHGLRTGSRTRTCSNS